MTLEQVKNVFVAVLPDATFHYEAWKKPERYIVWAEDGQSGAVYADNEMETQITEGTVDLYTKTEYDPLIKQIQKAMNSAEIAWKQNSTQLEGETGYIHVEWVWEVEEDIG